MKKVLIGVPTRGLISLGTVQFLLGQESRIYFAPSIISVIQARRKIVDTFLNDDFDSLFFLDDDVAPSVDVIERLSNYDKDIVSANYPIYLFGNIKSCAYSVKEENYVPFGMNENVGLQKVDAVGLGACLIKRKVFEKLGVDFFIHYNGAEMTIGEDVDFCNRARKEGFEIYCDFNCICDHYKNISIKTLWDKFVTS